MSRFKHQRNEESVEERSVAKCGRRPVLDQFKKREILAILSVGCSRRTAARYVGCATSTIQNTADRDPAFAEQLRHAECESEIGYLKNIRNAARKEQYWRAAAWALERRNPQDFAPRGPDVITVDQIKQIMAQFAAIIVEDVPVAKYRKRILKRLGAMTAGLGRSQQDDVVDHEE